MKLTDQINDEFSNFFRGLGFLVTWDFKKQTGAHWYEIYDGEILLCQVDFGTPLVAFLEDLPLFANGAEDGTSTHDYIMACDDPQKLRRILSRMKKQGNS